MTWLRKRPAPSLPNTPPADPTSADLKLRLHGDATGPDIHVGYYKRDAADALAEIERLEGLLARLRERAP